MEVEAGRVLWGRSVDRFKLRYKVLLSDGDAKTHKEQVKLNPYGEGMEVEKEECVNHVAKRLSTGLRNLVTTCSKQGVTLGGRGKGQLTGNAIRKLTIYYNRAVRKSVTAEEMKDNILASVYHCGSTDAKPRHELCPAGADSWCFFQAALAQKKVPGPHTSLVHTPLNLDKLEKHLMPVYDRLTDMELLNRCVSGKTQNSNECLHSVVWNRCPKENFASPRRVHFAVLTGINEFNFGSTAAQDTARFFGFKAGGNMQRLGAARQKKRERNSIQYYKDKASKRRDTVRAAKLKRADELMELEGGPAYAAGQF